MRASVVPLDLGDRIVERISPPVAAAGSWVRYALGVVAASLVVLSLPQLFVAGVDAEHSMRHAGAFGVALGVGLAWAAWRPERAAGLVPLALALVAAVVAGSVFDIATGRAAALSEAVHALEVVGVWLLVLLTGGGVSGIRQRWRHLLGTPTPAASSPI
jgi:predicted anti-sigma-YlaC factor YlaD